jgi:hypothetical protein
MWGNFNNLCGDNPMLEVKLADKKWHVFNEKHQVAGPYDTQEQANEVKRSMNKAASKQSKPWNWGVTAGGTFAAPDKHGYTYYCDIGEYHISPISSKTNVNRHIGYLVQFANSLGKVHSNGGLWKDLSKTKVNLVTAKRLCREHYEANKDWAGELVACSECLQSKPITQVMAGVCTECKK